MDQNSQENNQPAANETITKPDSLSLKSYFHHFYSKKVFGTFLAGLLIIVVATNVFILQNSHTLNANAQAVPQYTIFNDALTSGWSNTSGSNTTVKVNVSSPVYSGTRSISYKQNATTSANFVLHTTTSVDTSPYVFLHFALRGTTANQKYAISLLGSANTPLGTPVPLASLGGDPGKNVWKVYNIPLISLNAAATGITGFSLQSATGVTTTQPLLYLDEIQLLGQVAASPTIAVTSIPTTTPASTPSAIPSPSVVPTITQGNWWKPTATAPIQMHWQLSTDFNPTTDFVPGATVYDFDGEHTTKAIVDAVHAKGYVAVCYLDVGVFETYRKDASLFPGTLPDGTRGGIAYTGDPQFANVDVIGAKDVGWNGSYWLDIRRLDVIGPIMKNRFQMCKDKGFDAVEPDEENGFDNTSGFPLTYQDQLVYNKWIADTVHALGMSVGLKSDQAQAADLVNIYDWNLTEECYQYKECTMLAPFKAANKATWIVEYKATPNCTDANTNHYNAMKRDLDLVGPIDTGYLFQPCEPVGATKW